MAASLKTRQVLSLLNKLQSLSIEKSCSCLSTSSIHHVEKKTSVGNAGAEKAEKISQAMKAYLERANSHKKFMEEEIAEYEIGRRHLANIMSEDPDTFDQGNIDKAVEYLLPSSLFEKKARPMMRHPTDVLPKRKAAEFGVDGRPFNTFFYTGTPDLYTIMHDLAMKLEELKVKEDEMLREGKLPSPEDKLILAGSNWIGKKEVEQKLNEKLGDIQYLKLIKLLDRLAQQPYSYLEKDLIFTYRRYFTSEASNVDIPPLEYDEAGRPYQCASSKRKNATCKVTVYGKGSGQFTVNGQDILTLFPSIIDREQLMHPLQFVDKLTEVDVEATAEDGGPSGQAGAIRHAMSVALRSFVDRDMVEKMRLAGLLTRDPRVRERKKYGQERARKKFTWKKR